MHVRDALLKITGASAAFLLAGCSASPAVRTAVLGRRRGAIGCDSPGTSDRDRVATALDMNTGWPAALTFRHVGAMVASTRLSPVMTQYLNAYYSGPQKDFVAVEVMP